MLWAYDLDTMTDFTERYKAMSAIDVTDLPYWDLCAAVRPAGRLGDWGLDTATKKAMREDHTLFITQAFDALAHR